MTYTRRTKISNQSQRPMVIFVEPECLDYWMAPGESFEIRAEASSPETEFDFSLHGDGLSVYPAYEMGEVSVYHGDTLLEWSHQRPEGWPARQE